MAKTRSLRNLLGAEAGLDLKLGQSTYATLLGFTYEPLKIGNSVADEGQDAIYFIASLGHVAAPLERYRITDLVCTLHFRPSLEYEKEART